MLRELFPVTVKSVKIVDTEVLQETKLLFVTSSYVKYVIEVESESCRWLVSRRFSDFEELHKKLVVKGIIGLPQLAEKKLGGSSAPVVDQRQSLFTSYLQHLVSSSQILDSKEVRAFLDLSAQEKRVISLKINNRSLTLPPVQLLQLTELQELDLSFNMITSVPFDALAPTIKDLNLSNNQISVLEPTIAALKPYYLNLSNNSLTLLPSELGQLTSLIRLDLSNNSIEAIPPDMLSKLTSLQELSLCNNMLAIIPPEMPLMPNLSILDISDNYIKEVSATLISGLKSVTRLLLRNNMIKIVPSELWTLPNLKFVDFSGNPKLRKIAPGLIPSHIEFHCDANKEKLPSASPATKSSPFTLATLSRLRKKKDKKGMEISRPTSCSMQAHIGEDLNWNIADPESEIVRIGVLGAGAFGTVYHALWHGTYPLAVKIVLPVPHSSSESTTNESNPATSSLVETELAVLKQCRHPNTVGYMGFLELRSEIWMMMEFCGGGSVRDIIENTEELPTECIVYIIEGALKGLQYLHSRSIVHLDIKGGTDFGVASQLMEQRESPQEPSTPASPSGPATSGLISRLSAAASAAANVIITLTQGGPKKPAARGTLCWMAPEILMQFPYSPKADIYSLGKTAYELAEGNPPYSDAPTLEEIAHHIISEPCPELKKKASESSLQNFITTCTARNPDARPMTDQLLCHALFHEYNDPTPPAPSTPTTSKTSRSLSPSRVSPQPPDTTSKQKFNGKMLLEIALAAQNAKRAKKQPLNNVSLPEPSTTTIASATASTSTSSSSSPSMTPPSPALNQSTTPPTLHLSSPSPTVLSPSSSSATNSTTATSPSTTNTVQSQSQGEVATSDAKNTPKSKSDKKREKKEQKAKEKAEKKAKKDKATTTSSH
ncbi:STE20 family protein kinase [Pelomyxa schiedti]|nr:STE20 family protein kinase [Pelomyxa schiedti]